MVQIDWNSFFSLILNKSLEFIFGIISGAISVLIAYKITIKGDLLKLKTELKQALTKEQIIKEKQIIDDLWLKTRQLLEKASILTSRLKEYPDLKFLTGDALDEYLQVSFLTERQKKELLTSHDKNEYFQKAKGWHEYIETASTHNSLLSCLEENRIHISKSLLEKYDQLIKYSKDLLISYKIWLESNDHTLLDQSYEEFNRVSKTINEIEQESRKVIEKFIINE